MSKPTPEHLEEIESLPGQLQVTKSKVGVSGTVKLTAGTIVYIPAPTADPQGKLLIDTSYGLGDRSRAQGH